jgi:hypothetical protein
MRLNDRFRREGVSGGPPARVCYSTLNGHSLLLSQPAGHAPVAVIEADSHSLSFRTSFDDTKSRLGRRERYVVGNYRLR